MDDLQDLKPLNNSFVIARFQTTNQIAAMIMRAILESEAAGKLIASKFSQSTDLTKAKKLYFFAKNLFPYVRESGANQTAKTLPRIIADGKSKGGDCKHYTTTIIAIARALNIPAKMRLISQEYGSKNPTHIYAVLVIDGREYIVDPCMKNFNQEARYTYKRDVIVKPLK